ncbi:MAG: hypothetical protein IJJ34_06440 [Clostridia bacterium]|nr:hypothetical protein [Clostridia bacterium]
MVEETRPQTQMRHLVCPVCRASWFAVAPGSALLQRCHKCKREFWVTADAEKLEIRIRPQKT